MLSGYKANPRTTFCNCAKPSMQIILFKLPLFSLPRFSRLVQPILSSKTRKKTDTVIFTPRTASLGLLPVWGTWLLSHGAGGAPQPAVEGTWPQADAHGGRGGSSMQHGWRVLGETVSGPDLVTDPAAVTAIVVALEAFGGLSGHTTPSHQGHTPFPGVRALLIIDCNCSPGEALVTARAARTWGFSPVPSWGPWSFPPSCQDRKAGRHCLAWRSKSWELKSTFAWENVI